MQYEARYEVLSARAWHALPDWRCQFEWSQEVRIQCLCAHHNHDHYGDHEDFDSSPSAEATPKAASEAGTAEAEA